MQIVKLVDCWWRELLTYKMGSVYYDEKLFAVCIRFTVFRYIVVNMLHVARFFCSLLTDEIFQRKE